MKKCELTQHILKHSEFEKNLGGQRQNESVKRLTELIGKWSPNARFGISDLHLLSDRRVQSLCVLPDGFDEKQIFGEEICNLNNRQICGDNSLFCSLCRDENVTLLEKAAASPPSLKVDFSGVRFDCSFVILPIVANIPRGPIDAAQIGIFARIFGRQIDKILRENELVDEGMFKNEQKWHAEERKRLTGRAKALDKKTDKSDEINKKLQILDKNFEMLSEMREQSQLKRKLASDWTAILGIIADFGVYANILSLLLGHKENGEKAEMFSVNCEKKNGADISELDKFRIIFCYLEKWAKGKHIYDGTMGYLEPKTLAIMLTKVFLLYPKASAPFLIDKFFLTYSFWEWAVPVQLAPIDRSRRAEFLSWSPGREWFSKKQFSPKNLKKGIRKEMAMAVITPTFPEQNAASQVNLSTAKVIRNEMIKAMKQLKNTPDIRRAIIKPLEKDKFTEKFDHFIVVTCAGPHFHIDKFCAFVGKRLRHELLEFVESPLAKWVRFCQVFPNWMAASKECVLPDPSEMCKKRWLVGIELLHSEYVEGRQTLAAANCTWNAPGVNHTWESH
uniref:polynucleotide adenylyltransferase n=1 Tax=Globodera rostochiensis TaxID=31243 RepID=A0A914HYV4_GLORO